jgi:hypothetical protein
MSQRIEFENIKEMRREAGIDDVELSEEVRGLRVGDVVRLTACVGTKTFPGDCILVRITSIKGNVFRGKMARKPASSSLAQLKASSLLVFTTDHIHSVASKHSNGKD